MGCDFFLDVRTAILGRNLTLIYVGCIIGKFALLELQSDVIGTGISSDNVSLQFQ